LAALLNSLQMGFRTLAIQERSSEVWRVLGAVKTEFAKFAAVLAAAKKKIDEASKQIDQTGVRTRAITRTLRDVEALPLDEAVRLLPQPQPAEPDSTAAIAEEPLEPSLPFAMRHSMHPSPAIDAGTSVNRAAAETEADRKNTSA
jgi:DNA anti-recombination protein RmuC